MFGTVARENNPMFDPKISYVLRELADWIELRTGGEEPRDVTRIKLARTMAIKAEQLEAALELFTRSLDRMSDDPQEDFEGFDEGDQPVAPFLVGGVASLPTDPIGHHECTKLTFERHPVTRQLIVICDKGQRSIIEIQQLTEASPTSTDVIMAMARQLASEHELNVQELFTQLQLRAKSGLKTITVATSSSPTRPNP